MPNWWALLNNCAGVGTKLTYRQIKLNHGVRIKAGLRQRAWHRLCGWVFRNRLVKAQVCLAVEGARLSQPFL
jgi:hypothetical protein